MSITTITVIEPRPALSELLAQIRLRGLKLRAGRDADQPRYRWLDVLPSERVGNLWPAIESHFSELHSLAESVAEKVAL